MSATTTTPLTCNALSFGEAYHVCAAALLEGSVRWRVVNAEARGALAIAFLDACAPGREHSGKGHTTFATKIVAEKFGSAPGRARTLIRDAWLPANFDRSRVVEFARTWLAPLTGKKVVIWNRNRDYESERNTSATLREQLSRLAREHGLHPILVGHRIDAPRSPSNLTGLWEEPGLQDYFEQLALFDHLMANHEVVGSVGSRSGAMDGPALLGLPTLYLEDPAAKHQQRMAQWIDGAVPGYARQYLNHVDSLGRCMTLADETSVGAWFTGLS